MEDLNSWLTTLQSAFLDTLRSLIVHIPDLLSALLLLLLGWLLARTLRRFSQVLLERTDQLIRRTLRGRIAEALIISERSIAIVSTLLFWLVLLVFLTAAAQISGLQIFSQWLGTLFGYLPTVLAGVFIVLAGFVFSLIMRDLTSAAASSAHIAQANLLGRLTQLFIMTITVVVGIAQIGIDVSFLTALITVLVGIFGAGLSLAFALGAKDLVGNLLAVRYVRQHLREGDSVRIGDSKGRIVEITSSHIVLELPRGREYVPAGEFLRRSAGLILHTGGEHGSD